jgi:hypothetical protein
MNRTYDLPEEGDPLVALYWRLFGIPPLHPVARQRRAEAKRVGYYLEAGCRVTLDGLLDGMEICREAAV